MITDPQSWYITNTGEKLAIRRQPSGREIWLQIDLPPTTNPRDPQSVRAALLAAVADLQAVADDTALIAQLAQTE